MAEQTWKVPLTPSQRWAFLQLAHEQEQKVSGPEGRRFRRWMRAFGLVPVRDELRNKGGVAEKLANSDAPSLFEITAENRDYALKLGEIPHHPSVEMVIGDVLDMLEDLKKEANYEPPEGLPDYDPALERWAKDSEERADAFAELDDALEHLTVEQLEELCDHVRTAYPSPEPRGDAKQPQEAADA